MSDYKEYKIENLEIGAGLNEVDNLKPSKYFYEAIKSSKTYEELENKLKEYHSNNDENTSSREKECDIVSLRIAQLLEKNTAFIFSPQTLKSIHKHLFDGIFDWKLQLSVGNFRRYNITKEESILNNQSVIYADHREINDYLNYDFTEEKKRQYGAMDTKEQIQNICSFISKVWEIHPFAEGNTRTTAVFSIKYLKTLGFETNNELFKKHSKYFRNALVLANFSNAKEGISYDLSYLESFYSKLIINNEIELKKMPQNIYAYSNKVKKFQKEVKYLQEKKDTLISSEKEKLIDNLKNQLKNKDFKELLNSASQESANSLKEAEKLISNLNLSKGR